MCLYTGDNLEVNQKYILAGDFKSDSPSFNMNGSEAITQKFFDQGKLVDISSPHMATMRFNGELLSKFTGPFNEYIVFTAFKLAFGRMHPKCPVAQKFAEGLINPNVGRGVNYKSVMTIAKNLDLPCTHGPDPHLILKNPKSISTTSLVKNGTTLMVPYGNWGISTMHYIGSM